MGLGVRMKVVLDTLPLIEFFKDEENANKVETILKKIEDEKIEACISSLTISELYYILAHFKNDKFAEKILRYIEISNINVVPVNKSIAEKGGEFKYKYSHDRVKKGLPLADCIIAATSWIERAILISSDDEHFKRIREIKYINTKDFS